MPAPITDNIVPSDSNGKNSLSGLAVIVSMVLTVITKSLAGVVPPNRFPGIVIVLVTV